MEALQGSKLTQQSYPPESDKDLEADLQPLGAATYKSLTKRDRFKGKFGTCFDGVIERELNSFVPKHKSYLSKKDLRAGKLEFPNKKKEMLGKSEAELLGEAAEKELAELHTEEVERDRVQKRKEKEGLDPL